MSTMHGSKPHHTGLEFLASLQLTHALDYVVLLHCALAHTDGSRISVHDLWRRLRERGVLSGNSGAGQLGRDSVYNSVNRLIEAGYLTRAQGQVRGNRFGPVEYRLSEEAVAGLGGAA